VSLAQLIIAAKAAQASDLHLEPGLPACARVRGQLRNLSSEALDARTVLGYAR